MTSSSPARHRRQRINLPDEMIELILSKCPVEPVIRFKSVSKSWQSIISDPRFSRIHRIQRSKLPEDQNKFFLWRKQGWREKGGLYMIRLEDENFRTKSESVLGYPCYGRFLEPLCSCDGLILFSAGNMEYMLWNPLIRKHINIPAFNPKSHPQAFVNWPLMCVHYYLYHDSITDDYKILLVCEKCYTVYSCKNGSWGEIKDFPCNRMECKAGIDGCLYDTRYYESSEIICFDARVGKLHKFPKPEGAECLVGVQLKAVSGRLCFYEFSNYCGSRLQMWVMEENGSFDKSWRKLISMEEEEPWMSNITPLWLTNKNDVVLWARVPKTEYGIYKHFIYNPRGNCSFKKIDFARDDRHQYFSFSENLDMPSSNIVYVSVDQIWRYIYGDFGKKI